MMGTVLSIDIGTSSLKAAYIDFDGKLLAFGREIYCPDPAFPGAGAREWEQAFFRALEKLHTQAPERGIDGVCISGNGPTLVPVTRRGEALPPLYWNGKSSLLPGAAEAPSFFLPHAAWFKENAPDDYGKTELLVSSHEWLAVQLGAGAVTVLPQTAYEPYYWNDDQCRLFGLDRKKFPPFAKMGSVIGTVSAEAASVFGAISGNRLKRGTPIIAGGPDFITALIGTGTLKSGDVCDRAGSSEGINVCAAAPLEGAGGKTLVGGKAADSLRSLPHAKEGLWNIGALIPSSGILFEKYRTATGQEHRPYDELLAELIPVTTDTDIFRNLDFSLGPQKAPPLNNSEFRIPNSALEPGRSVLCAMGFAVRSALRTLDASGFPVTEMKVSGGQGKNPRWNQLKADISGVSLVAGEIIDGELVGNAVLAAAALGAFPSFEEAADKMIRIREVYRPGNAAFWEEQYEAYKFGVRP